MTTNRDSLLVFIAGMALFTIGLPAEFTGFQCRFGLFIKEMLWNDPTLFPTVYGHPYPDYPATSTFLSWLLARIFGKVTPFMAILPSATASALILVFTYRIGALCSRNWGIYAVLVSLLTYQFVFESRTISLDQYTSLATIVSFYIVHTASVYGKTRRLWLVPLLFVAGFAFRGPVGLVIPAAVTCVYCLWERKFKLTIIFAAAAAVLMAACIAALVAGASVQGGRPFAEKVIGAQAAERMTDRPEIWSLYWLDALASYALAYPLALVIIASLFKPLFKRIDHDHKFLASMAICMLIIPAGLTIPAAKKIRYILPMVPFASLLVAYLLAGVSTNDFLRKVKDAVMSLFLWLPAGLFGAVVLVVVFGPQFDLHVTIKTLLLPAVFLLAAAIAAILASWRIRSASNRELALTALAAVAFNLFNSGPVESLTVSRGSTSAFAAELESLRKQTPGPLVFYRVGPDGEDVKYAVSLDYAVQPSYVLSPDELSAQNKTAYIVAFAKEFANLSPAIAAEQDIILRGNLGHKKCVVFRARQN
jgi:4-amino-4-deoxy-L-arabinose transferase-like glycosyltransferase